MISRKSILSALAVVILFAGAGVVSWQLLSNRSGAPASAGEATFAGSEVCAGCHQVENKLWHSSQHERAMAHATDKSVL
ncbi:MAG: hypothetical protein WCD59_19410, partial [Pseudolabrys sp.]